jgi:hypothetical protein
MSAAMQACAALSPQDQQIIGEAAMAYMSSNCQQSGSDGKTDTVDGCKKEIWSAMEDCDVNDAEMSAMMNACDDLDAAELEVVQRAAEAYINSNCLSPSGDANDNSGNNAENDRIVNAVADIFYAMDKNGNGIIDVNECTSFLKNIQRKLSDEQKKNPANTYFQPEMCEEMTKEDQDMILENLRQSPMSEEVAQPLADMLDAVVKSIYEPQPSVKTTMTVPNGMDETKMKELCDEIANESGLDPSAVKDCSIEPRRHLEEASLGVELEVQDEAAASAVASQAAESVQSAAASAGVKVSGVVTKPKPAPPAPKRRPNTTNAPIDTANSVVDSTDSNQMTEQDQIDTNESSGDSLFYLTAMIALSMVILLKKTNHSQQI